ncbi:MAG: hypothetical protein IJH14_06630 [Solobacterium sp.]|nr:hypothetical protein [Solobacterium sp.]
MFIGVIVAALLMVMAFVIWACIDEIRSANKKIRECQREIIDTRQLIFAQKDFIQRKTLEIEAQRQELKEMQARLIDVQNRYVAAKRRLEIYANEKVKEAYEESGNERSESVRSGDTGNEGEDERIGEDQQS